MAKAIKRERAIALRRQGKSIKAIAKILHVSKSSASIWCKNVDLTKEQIKRLHESMVSGSYAGRMKGAEMQHKKRIKRQEEAEIIGKKEIGKLSDRDFLIALTALYWGEGSKKKRELFIVNSDPEMVKFLIKALKKIFGINNDRLYIGVGININHKSRDEEVRDYWSKITGIPKNRFRKTIFTKSKNKKSYKNFQNYYGMLRINVAKSTDIYYKMIGLIKGLTAGLK